MIFLKKKKGDTVMRLFIAINFTDENRRILADAAELLRSNSRSGTFTREENFHLTLAFLGEVEPYNVKKLRQIMAAAADEAFDFEIGGLGKFKRTGGDIYWLGVERKPELMTLAKNLQDNLRAGGFDIEDRAFKPHLTLGRQVILNCDPKSLDMPTIKCHAGRISLMQSERVRGVLTYTEIYGKELR